MMEYQLIIPFTLPSLNDYTAACRKVKYSGNKLKRETEEALITVIKAQLRGVRIKSPVFIKYLWVEKDRKRDKDNVAFAKKFIQDALVTAKVLYNDNWACVTGFSDEFTVDKRAPRVEVVICEEKRNENVIY